MSLSMQQLLTFTLKKGASDLHLSAGLPPTVRLHGEMARLDIPPLTDPQLLELLHSIMTPEQKTEFSERLEIDFAIQVPDAGRFRVNTFMQTRGPAAVLRTIPEKVPTLEDLKQPEILGELALKERGLILVTGPTGSGKSTTLSAMVNHINLNKRGHIITIEDPIEFMHTPKSCIINQREVGKHTHSFANALKSALREDPDVILVGELRDLETTQLAITAAETGHVVFGTLHTSSAAKTVDRVIDIFPPAQQAQIRSMFSESIMGIVSQTLIPTMDGQGRACAQEILVAVPAIRNLIREEKTAQIQTAMQTGGSMGMQTLDQALKRLIGAGKISMEEAMARSANPQSFQNNMQQAEAANAKVVPLRRSA